LAAVLVSVGLAAGGTAAGVLLAPGSPARPDAAAGFAFSSPAPLPLSRGAAPSDLASAPAFSVRVFDGGTITLADVRDRPTVLFFMAYWCGTCIPEAQALGRLHREFASQGLRIIAVDIDPTSSREALAGFREAAGSPGYMFAFDDGGKTTRAYGIATLDATVIIDRDGRIAYRDAFVTDYLTLRDAIARVI
jgi:peroxiredoxin